MTTDELRYSKSFYGELSLASDGSKINFSKVVLSNYFAGRAGPNGVELIDDIGYELQFFEYMTANTFEDTSQKFYFRYSEPDDSYSLIMSDKGQVWVGITNNAYLWKTTDPTRCWHFQLFSEDKKKLALSDITGDTVKVYLSVPSRDGMIVDTYSRTTAGKHSWCYLTLNGGNDALFELKINERGIKGFWE